MSVIAKTTEDTIVVINGHRRLDAMIQTNGKARVLLDDEWADLGKNDSGELVSIDVKKD